MKRRDLTFPIIVLFVLSVLLISFGLISGFRLLSSIESELLNQNDMEILLDEVKSGAIYAMAISAIMVSGIAILLGLLIHMIRKSERIHREADELRLKNDAMEELNRQTKTLAHHQRLEMLGTLTSSIAHEFNNLLTPIMGYSLMALEKLPPDAEVYDNILEVYNASRSAKILISRLSDLSRKNTDDTFRIASADELIQKSLDIAAPAKPDAVEIKLDLNCQDQRIRVNEIQISQLLLNLILNSFHAMEQYGGFLTIKTSFDEYMVYIRVSDNGCGISEEHLGRIFDPFYSTKEVGKGTGLGLAIVAQVVEDHNGKIHVESKLGEGTSFTVGLPRNLYMDK